MNTVIFLGAGASKADNAPLQSEIFSSYFAARHDPNYANKFEYRVGVDIKEIVINFFRDFFNVTDEIYPTFEEALGVLQLDKTKSFKHLPYSLEEYQFSLILAMEEAIKYNLDYKHRGTGCRNYHTKLAYTLWEKKLQNEVTFISSNYDLLIDNALFYLPSVDYGLNIELKNDAWKLFKLHGSLNWIYCSNCNKIDTFPGEKVSLLEYFEPGKMTCACGENRESIIVPPTYFKTQLENSTLKSVWDHSRKALIDAEHIIFCGYSFPDADINIKYLLKSAELAPRSKLRKVTLVNHYGNVDDREEMEYKNLKKQEFDRFKRFFKCEIVDSNKSFEEFVDKPII